MRRDTICWRWSPDPRACSRSPREITVKLVPKPEAARVILAAFDDVEKAGAAVAAMIAAGIIPAGLEMMDQAATRAVEEYVHAGYDLDAAALLLCESDGTPEEVEEEIERMTEVLRGAGAYDFRVSQDEAERLKFWSGRKAAFPAMGRISPDYYCMDGTIPRKRLAEVLRFIAALEAKYGLRCPNVFHAGDGNLHPLILFDANDPDQLASHRAVRRRGAGEVHRGGRHDHGRARRRHREDQPDVRAVQPR